MSRAARLALSTLALGLLVGPSALQAQATVTLTSPAEPFTLEVHVAWGALRLSPSQSDLTWIAKDDDGRPAAVDVQESRNHVVIRQPPPAEGVFASTNLTLGVPPGGRVSIVVERGGDVSTSTVCDADLEITNSQRLGRRSGPLAARPSINATNGTIRAEIVEPNDRPLYSSRP